MDSEVTVHEANESKEARWKQILQQWKDSGLRACEFQRRNNLNKHAFIYWKLKLIGRTEKRQCLVPVKLRSVALRAGAPCSMRLRIGERYSVELTEGFDAGTLREVLRVVQECSQ
ncbi:MAG TPA: hypothetical protein VMU36_06160 [Spirochaetia bacterium]|nr:hypothetical protein [Spirochaetia bacterium]